MKLSHVGVDLAKNVFQLHGVDRSGKAVWRRRLRRHQWLAALMEAADTSCVIGMEACTGAHHWARQLQAQRNAKSNQIRGLLAEYGLVAPQTLLALRAAIPDWLEDAENGLTDHFRSLLHGLWGDLLALDERIKELDQKIEQLANGNEVTRRLQQLRGVGRSDIGMQSCHVCRQQVACGSRRSPDTVIGLAERLRAAHDPVWNSQVASPRGGHPFAGSNPPANSDQEIPAGCTGAVLHHRRATLGPDGPRGCHFRPRV